MKAIDQLKSVLCNLSGKCCIAGSDEDRAIIDQALEALERLEEHQSYDKQEPVGFVVMERPPLTDEEIDRAVLDQLNLDRGTYAYLMAFKVARAIEAAHDIGKKT